MDLRYYLIPIFLFLFIHSSCGQRQEISLTNTITTNMTIEDTKNSREKLTTFIYKKLHCTSASASASSSCESLHIRTRHDDGCLDSGCCKYFSNSVSTQKNEDNFCPARPWLKWNFVDQFLVSDNPQLKIVPAPWEKSNLFQKSAVCLDCWNAVKECEIRTTVCWGPLNQLWRVQMYPGQIDNKNKKVFFSILSEGLNKDNCVHIVDANSTAEKIFPNYMNPPTWCQEPGVCLQLSSLPCTGNYWESFYLESLKWEDYLAYLQNPQSEHSTGHSEGNDPVFYIEVTLGALVLIGLGVALIFLWRKLSSAQKTLQNFYLLTNEEVDEFLYGNPHKIKSSGNAHENAIYMPFDRKYEIKEEDLIVEKQMVLGKGQFGVVTRGRLNGQVVAVKTTHSHVDVSYFKALLVEIKVMAYVGKQDQIVEFLGCVTNKIEERMAYLVIEYSPLGDLQSYLIRQRNTFVMSRTEDPPIKQNSYVTMAQATALCVKDLTYFAFQIACGLEFLAMKQVIHGDLACRNILVFENNTVKITDFGLARKLYTYGKYKKKKPDYLPWRWLAVESLRDLEFSVPSDIWSFGVTSWEIFTLAETPYHGLSYSLDFVDKIQQGLRLQKPKFASQAMYEEIILSCWNLIPQDRPSASQLKERLENLLSQYK